MIEGWLEEADPSLPIILTAHASIEGAKFGGERLVMLGNDLVLSGSLVKNPKFSYVAMGHIHKPQDVNEGYQPPSFTLAPSSAWILAKRRKTNSLSLRILKKEKTREVEWVELKGVRTFIDRRTVLRSSENVTDALKDALPSPKEMSEAIVRLVGGISKRMGYIDRRNRFAKICRRHV